MIEGIVWNEVKNLLSKPKLIREQYNKWLSLRRKRFDNKSYKLSDIEKELDNLNKTEQRLIEGYTAGVIPLDHLKSKLSEIKLNKSKLEQDKNNLSNMRNSNMEKISPRHICKEFKSFIKKITFNKKERILHSVLKEVLIEQDKAIIRGCVPLSIQPDDELRSIYDTSRKAPICYIHFYRN